MGFSFTSSFLDFGGMAFGAAACALGCLEQSDVLEHLCGAAAACASLLSPPSSCQRSECGPRAASRVRSHWHRARHRGRRRQPTAGARTRVWGDTAHIMTGKHNADSAALQRRDLWGGHACSDAGATRMHLLSPRLQRQCSEWRAREQGNSTAYTNQACKQLNTSCCGCRPGLHHCTPAPRTPDQHWRSLTASHCCTCGPKLAGDRHAAGMLPSAGQPIAESSSSQVLGGRGCMAASMRAQVHVCE